MSKVTSKLQVTLPKELADKYGIHPGDEIEWKPVGDAIRVSPPSARRSPVRSGPAPLCSHKTTLAARRKSF